MGGGPGLVEGLTKAAAKAGIAVAYEARALALIADDDGVKGVRVRHKGKTVEVAAKCVVLAAGGFQANAEWRTRYLGPGWELAKVRGTRFNTGDGIRMALDIGAQPTGNWSGWHAVGWDRNAPEFGDLEVGDNFQKHNYPFSHHAQRQRRALRRRGRRLPQLHLRQVRPRDPEPAGASSPGRCSTARCCTCCATNTASSASPRCGPTRWKSWWRSSTT